MVRVQRKSSSWQAPRPESGAESRAQRRSQRGIHSRQVCALCAAPRLGRASPTLTDIAVAMRPIIRDAALVVSGVLLSGILSWLREVRRRSLANAVPTKVIQVVGDKVEEVVAAAGAASVLRVRQQGRQRSAQHQQMRWET